MKKIYTLFAAALCAASLFAGSYGVAVNGKTYYAGTENPNPIDPTFQEFMVLGLALNIGDNLQLYDPSGNDGKGAGWAVALDNASTPNIQLEGDHYVCNVAGCYDFYIKLKFQQDQLYVGEGECGSPTGTEIGGDDPVTPPVGPGEDDDVNYYIMGWINGADAGESAYDTFEDKYLFIDGKLTLDCRQGSYVGVKDHSGNFYYSKTQTTIQNTTVCLDWANGWAGCEKWAIPEGVNYIIIRSAQYKGQIQLERVDKDTYDAYHWGGSQHVEETVVCEKAHKVFVNGQLRIVRGDKTFDATGREL